VNNLRNGCYGAGPVGFWEGVGVLTIVQEGDTAGTGSTQDAVPDGV